MISVPKLALLIVASLSGKTALSDSLQVFSMFGESTQINVYEGF